MVRQETDFLNNNQENASEFFGLKTMFALGVDWEGASFLRIPPEITDQINKEAADNLLRLKRHLKLPYFPTIKLLTGWNEVLPEDERLINEIYGEVMINDFYPYGMIRISPSILKAIVTEKTGINQRPDISLGGLLAHEDFHIWQYLYTPQQIERDLSSRAISGIEAWSQTETEREAREFEKRWI